MPQSKLCTARSLPYIYVARSASGHRKHPQYIAIRAYSCICAHIFLKLVLRWVKNDNIRPPYHFWGYPYGRYIPIFTFVPTEILIVPLLNSIYVRIYFPQNFSTRFLYLQDARRTTQWPFAVFPPTAYSVRVSVNLHNLQPRPETPMHSPQTENANVLWSYINLVCTYHVQNMIQGNSNFRRHVIFIVYHRTRRRIIFA